MLLLKNLVFQSKKFTAITKKLEIIKDQLIDKLIEQYIQVIEYVNQYYEASLFEPLKMCSMFHESISIGFPDIFRFAQLSLHTILECNGGMFF